VLTNKTTLNRETREVAKLGYSGFNSSTRTNYTFAPKLVGAASCIQPDLLRPSLTEPTRSGLVLVLLQLLVSGVLAGLPQTVPLLTIGAKGHDRAVARRVGAPFTLAAPSWSLLVIASNITPHYGSKE
jgi:hypothetical protein